MNALPIRSARTEDIDAIMLLEQLGFHQAICESRAVMQQRLRHFGNGFLILENAEGNTIGYLCSEVWKNNNLDHAHFALGHDIIATHRTDGRQLYISSMTIHPDHRGGGLGKHFFVQSLALMRSRLPNVNESILLLSTEWRGAHRIYQSCGYQEVTRLPHFFAAIAQRDTDAIVMKLSFL